MFLILFAWSPWMTEGTVDVLIREKFQSEWYGVMDGCSLKEIKETQRSFFGFKSFITYECGMGIYFGEKSELEWHNVFVSLFGTVYGDFIRK